MIRLALVLPPRHRDLICLMPAVGRLDAVVVTPENTWKAPGYDFSPNGFATLFGRARGHRDRVGHAVASNLGSFHEGEVDHHEAWLRALRRDHAAHPFDWLSDHAVATRLGGEDLRLPVPLPFTRTLAHLVRRRLDALRTITGLALIETSAWTHRPPDLHLEAAFYAAATDAPGLGLLLDLHNVWTNAQNFGVDPDDFIASLPLERVVEVHISGGQQSDPAWCPGPPMRLDSHDHAVPEPVFALLSRWLPHLPALEQVTLERIEGSLGDHGADEVEAELERLRAIVMGPRRPLERTPVPSRATLPGANPADHLALESWLAAQVRGAPPTSAPPEAFAAYAAALDDHTLRVTRALVAKLRFERLVSGSRPAGLAFAADPTAFTAQFRAYHTAVAPKWVSPHEEARAWAAFTGT